MRRPLSWRRFPNLRAVFVACCTAPRVAGSRSHGECKMGLACTLLFAPTGPPQGRTYRRKPMHILGVQNSPRIFFRAAVHFTIHRSIVRLHLWHPRTSRRSLAPQRAVCGFFPGKNAATRCHNATCVCNGFMHHRRHPYASTYAYAKLHFGPPKAPPPCVRRPAPEW